MKPCLGLVVAAALCLEMAQALSCFTCNTATTSSECNEKTNCSALSSRFAACKTTVMSPDVGFPFKGNEMVFRQCVESCIPTGANWLGVTRKILCCNLDFCNGQGIVGFSQGNNSGTIDNCNNHGAATGHNLHLISVIALSAITYSLQ